MGLINYEQLEDGFDASANLWNERFGIVFNEINGNLDAANLKNYSVTEEKIATGAISARTLGLEQYIDDNGWTIIELGLVKLAAKRRTFTIPSIAQGAGTWATLDTDMDNSPVGFNDAAPYRVMHTPYVLGIDAVGPWDLKMKEEDGIGFMKPGSKVVASRISGGTSTAGVQGAVETWVIF